MPVSLEALDKKPPHQARRGKWWEYVTSKDELVESMYEYFRGKAKDRTGNMEVDYGKLVEGRPLKEILTGVVAAYRNMNYDSDMNQFYRLIMAERAYSPIASAVMVEETKKMITATRNLFYAISVKGAAHFDDPDGAALIFAMGIHSLLDLECDAKNAGITELEGSLEHFIDEFCRNYEVKL